jgi:hypothetical protein
MKKVPNLKEDAMKTLITTILAVLGWVVPAIAAGTTVATGSSVLVILFLGFAAIIVVFQFIPGLLLFFSMLKGLFTAAPKKAEVHGKK